MYRKTRALILSPSLRARGGVQQYIRTLVSALRALVGEQQVVLWTIPQRRADTGGHTRVHPGERARFVAGALWHAWRLRPTLIISAHVAVAPVGWLLHRLWRAPHWVVGYGVDVWGTLPWWKQKPLAAAQRVVAISKFTAQHMVRRQHVAESRLSVLPCALDERLLHVEPDRGWLVAHNLADSPFLLTVGRLAASERYKGHDVVIRALPKIISRVPDIRYLIIGDGDDRPRLERLAVSHGVAEHVVFAGAVNDAQLAAAYRACRAFIMPARTLMDENPPKGEGFGIVFLEAMAFGKPVVGPRYGAPAEFIEHGKHGLLVNPESPEEVANTVVHLLRNPSVAEGMGAQARAWVQQEFSFVRFKERLSQLLDTTGYKNGEPVS